MGEGCKRAKEKQIVIEEKRSEGKRSRKNVEVDKEGKKVCVVGNNKKDSVREKASLF